MKYIHKKTGKPYSLIGKTMFKDNGVWRKDLVLYKAEYKNPDGEYFVRTKEDFDKSFTKDIKATTVDYDSPGEKAKRVYYCDDCAGCDRDTCEDCYPTN